MVKEELAIHTKVSQTADKFRTNLVNFIRQLLSKYYKSLF